MAGQVTISQLQIGDSATATQNFVLKVPAAPDGTIALYRGNYGAESATIFSVSAAGALSFNGTTTNDSAAAGCVGEWAASAISGAQNTGASGVFWDAATVSLTAGDWDVYTQNVYDINTATWSELDTGISATSGNSSTGMTRGYSLATNIWTNSNTTPGYFTHNVGPIRMSLASTTSIYSKSLAIFSAGQPQSVGCRIWARRVR